MKIFVYVIKEYFMRCHVLLNILVIRLLQIPVGTFYYSYKINKNYTLLVAARLFWKVLSEREAKTLAGAIAIISCWRIFFRRQIKIYQQPFLY